MRNEANAIARGYSRTRCHRSAAPARLNSRRSSTDKPIRAFLLSADPIWKQRTLHAVRDALGCAVDLVGAEVRDAADEHRPHAFRARRLDVDAQRLASSIIHLRRHLPVGRVHELSERVFVPVRTSVAVRIGDVGNETPGTDERLGHFALKIRPVSSQAKGRA